MIELSRCGVLCAKPVSFVGPNRDGVMMVVCEAHRYLLVNAVPIRVWPDAIGVTVERVRENQAAMEELLDSGGT